MTASELAVGNTTAGRYAVIAPLGEGTFGPVYRAEDLLRRETGQHSEVAVKWIPSTVVDQLGGIEQLAPRLSAACRVNHPGIVNVFDFHREEGGVIVVLEYLEGSTLASLMADHDRLPSADALDLLAHLVDALTHAHKNGFYLVLNPGKIWLDKEGRPKIADIGLAPLGAISLWSNAALLSGSAAYFAPEVISGSPVPDHRADQFSIAVIAVELLTGSNSARDPDSIATLERHCPTRCITALNKMLEIDPRDRFDELSLATEAFAAVHPQRREANTLLTHLSSWRRTLAFVALLAIAFAIAAGTWRLAKDDNSTVLADEISAAILAVENQIRSIDETKLDLYKTALHRDEFEPAIRRFCNSRPEFEIAQKLVKAQDLADQDDTSAVDTMVALGSIKASLAIRQTELRSALLAVQAKDTISEAISLRASLIGKIPSLPAPQDGAAAKDASGLDAALEEAGAAFSAGLFAVSIEAAKSVDTFFDLLHTDIAELEAEARASSQAWQNALESRSLPTAIEPVGSPRDALRDGCDKTLAGDWHAAIAAFTKSAQIYGKWADRLDGIPQPRQGDFENSIGMRFRKLRPGLQCSVWETRLIDFLVFLNETGLDPSRQWREFAIATDQGPDHPVVFINYTNAVRFCDWLTRRERSNSTIGADQTYRIPTDREWSEAVGLPRENGLTPDERQVEFPQHYPWPSRISDRSVTGNYDTAPNRDSVADFKRLQDSFRYTSPVGSFSANRHGLFDMGGNVFEWTADKWNSRDGSPPSQSGPENKILRGGGWRTISRVARRSTYRQSQLFANEDTGFRIVLTNLPPKTGGNHGQ